MFLFQGKRQKKPETCKSDDDDDDDENITDDESDLSNSVSSADLDILTDFSSHEVCSNHLPKDCVK